MLTAPELAAFIDRLVCARCLECIEPTAPPDVDVCGRCYTDLRDEDAAADAAADDAGGGPGAFDDDVFPF